MNADADNNPLINNKLRIAVIGAGISGLSMAYFLNKKYDVVLYESAHYLGGHANTVDVTIAGQTHPVDTGFLVLNDHTYPNLLNLFKELKVETYPTEMSFAVSMQAGRFEWAGTSLATLFACRRNLISPSFWQMIRSVLKFNRHAKSYLQRCIVSQETLGELLQREGYRGLFVDAYLIPMAAAIWSSTAADILQFPASSFLRFCLNHGLLQITGRPQWRTVTGGSRSYVRKIAQTLPDIRLNQAVLAVTRRQHQVLVQTAKSEDTFDHVVFATHAPTTLALLNDGASLAEREILQAVQYQPNTAYLHTDHTLLPKRKGIWSAWNYIESSYIESSLSNAATNSGANPVCVSYLINKLQQLPFKTPVIVTLNPTQLPAPNQTIATFNYEHPVFDQSAILAQARLHEIQGVNHTWFVGAWAGYGFHEDGLQSALNVLKFFGAQPDWMT